MKCDPSTHFAGQMRTFFLDACDPAAAVWPYTGGQDIHALPPEAAVVDGPSHGLPSLQPDGLAAGVPPPRPLLRGGSSSSEAAASGVFNTQGRTPSFLERIAAVTAAGGASGTLDVRLGTSSAALQTPFNEEGSQRTRHVLKTGSLRPAVPLPHRR